MCVTPLGSAPSRGRSTDLSLYPEIVDAKAAKIAKFMEIGRRQGTLAAAGEV